MREFVVNQNLRNPVRTAREAIDAVVALGEGTVARFHAAPDAPNRKPNAMWRYRNGVWHEWSVFTGNAWKQVEGKPY